MCDCENNYCITASKVVRKARKDHKCCECYRVISAGERYEYVSGLWRDSGFDDFKTCGHCAVLRRIANDVEVPDHACICFGHTGLLEELRELFGWPAVASGMPLARLYRSARRKWRYRRGPRKGLLMPVPEPLRVGRPEEAVV